MSTERISRRFAASFPDNLPWRTVGREAEFPIVDDKGNPLPLSQLWPELMADGDLTVKREGDLIVGLLGPQYEIAAEVGRGTVEIITGPKSDLTQIERDHNTALYRVATAAQNAGGFLLGYGCQPKTTVNHALMTQKARYGVLNNAIGDNWLWFAATASDQVHAAVARHEVVAATNLVNALSAVTVVLCGNSPIIEGQHHGAISAREQLMGKIGAGKGRHGMPITPIANIQDHIDQLATLPHLMQQTSEGLAVGTGPFTAFLDANPTLTEDDAFSAFLLHEHYVWQSGRPRSNHGTVEVRSAGQQPHADSMCAAALGVAMITCHVALTQLLIDRLGTDYWETLRDWHHRVIIHGLQTDEPVTGLLTDIVDICTAGLANRGRGEERYLSPFYRRIKAQKNPGNVALERYKNGGMSELLAHTKIEIGS